MFLKLKGELGDTPTLALVGLVGTHGKKGVPGGRIRGGVSFIKWRGLLVCRDERRSEGGTWSG